MKKVPKMNGLFRAAFIMLIICVAAVIIAAVVSYALDQTTIGLAISGVGSVLALVGIILASKSKPKPEPELEESVVEKEYFSGDSVISSDDPDDFC